MKKLLKNIAIIAVILGAIQLIGMWYFGKLHAELSETYALSDESLAYATTCESRMNWHDQEFTSGRDTLDGCGCVAGQVQEMFPDDMVAGETVIKDAMNWLAKDDTSEPDWNALAKTAGVEGALYDALLTTSLVALQSCNAATPAS